MTYLLTLAVALFLLLASCSTGKGERVGTLEVSVQPDGQMAVVRDQRLLIRDRSGVECEILRAPDGSFPSFPVWSPDDTRIAYAVETPPTGHPADDSGSDIHILDAAAGSTVLLWRHDQPGVRVQGLAWTPDGRYLLFGYQRSLYSADLTFHGQIERIERLSVDDGAREMVAERGFFPSVSRNGQLAYQTREPDGQAGIWISSVNGSGARRLVDLGPRLLATYPRIAPDGNVIVLAATAAQGSEPMRRSRWLRTALRILPAAYRRGARSPLGSVAGYGRGWRTVTLGATG